MSKPQTIGMVSGETDEGPVEAAGLKTTPERMAEAEDHAIEVAETLARHHGVVTTKLEDGTVVECRNARVGQIGLVLRFLKHVIKQLNIQSTDEEYLEAAFESLKQDPMAVIELIETADSYIWKVMAALTSLENEEAVSDLDLEDAMKIAKILWELNKGFFLKKVLPMALGTIRVK